MTTIAVAWKPGKSQDDVPPLTRSIHKLEVRAEDGPGGAQGVLLAALFCRLGKFKLTGEQCAMLKELADVPPDQVEG